MDLPDPAGERPAASVDVVVVGGGYTGLGAALELARRGRSVAVLDSGGIARGASSRNGGMVHPGVKHDLASLLAEGRGRRRFDDTLAAYDGLSDLIAQCGIDCDFVPTGHLELAHHPRQAEGLRRAAAAYASIGQAASFVGRDELGAEIGSAEFFGGLAVEHSGAVHPAKLAAGLARAASEAGASLHPGTSVLGIERKGAGHAVRTTGGEVAAAEVVVATNGTTDGRLVPWLGRRVLGVGSFIIATEPLPPDLAAPAEPPGPHVLRFQELPQLLAPLARRQPRPVRRTDVLCTHVGRGGSGPPCMAPWSPCIPSSPAWEWVAGLGRPGGPYRGTAFLTSVAIARARWCTPWGTAGPAWHCRSTSAAEWAGGCAVTVSSPPSPSAGGPGCPPRHAGRSCCGWRDGGTGPGTGPVGDRERPARP